MHAANVCTGSGPLRPKAGNCTRKSAERGCFSGASRSAQVSRILSVRVALLPKKSLQRTRTVAISVLPLWSAPEDLALLPALARPQLERCPPAGRDGRLCRAQAEGVAALADVAAGPGRDDLGGAGAQPEDDAAPLRLGAGGVEEQIVDPCRAGRGGSESGGRRDQSQEEEPETDNEATGWDEHRLAIVGRWRPPCAGSAGRRPGAAECRRPWPGVRGRSRPGRRRSRCRS